MFEDSAENSQRGDTAQRYYGKYPGLVIDNRVPDNDDDDEDYGDHRGELLVKVPGILEQSSDGEGQQPIEVWAKPCFHPGFFVIPEKNAKIWVEFVAGDINSPVWTGVWYPRNSTPQTVDAAGPTEFQKVIRTASGHVVQLDDTEDEEKIVINHKQGSLINIDKDGHILIEHTDGFTVELKADNTVEVNCDMVQINADVTIDGNLDVAGDVVVGQGPKTTISGNEITGG